jgi:hypothetical protein
LTRAASCAAEHVTFNVDSCTAQYYQDGTRIVTYADDLVILCRRGKAEEALQQLRKIMSKLKLAINEEKTQICRVPEGEFVFLGYTFARMYSARTERLHARYRKCPTVRECAVLPPSQ